MSFGIQNNYLDKAFGASDLISIQNKKMSSISDISAKSDIAVKTKEVGQTKALISQEMELFKKEFFEELAGINSHITVSGTAINISEQAFKKMKENPEYREKILSLIKRDLGDSYAPRNCSVMITVGGSLNEYRADSWPVTNDSEFSMRSQNSFYKKTVKSRKNEQKELLEKYLEHKSEQKLLTEKLLVENEARRKLRKADAEKAYSSQTLFDI
ncbi:hypothetical protein DFR58_12324 [Anaerobacterium chartisolvens]|uniref:Uncharacterized protein n=1 Tax=Anaerobacterium chartisolvens TaxID=1297424 RepID=A0A369AXQ6_9FIRM|nr:hypothetical protein [Anaerobacterium chartisolvens]RCX12214.1 hypothetical protein DFR58_12324 [Anaerobacterium chartisolvens]